MILLFHNFLHFAKLLNKKYGTHTESRILHLHKIFYSAHQIMKRLLIIICSCLLYIGLCSAKTKIYLERKQKNAQTRSLVTEPTANHEGNTIYLQSDVSIKELQVTVKDEKGNIISSEFISLSSQQSYAFSIGGAKEGIYILELNDGKEEYYGYFEIY